jgi:hypothetical protein
MICNKRLLIPGLLCLFILLQSTAAFADPEWQWTCQTIESENDVGRDSSLLEGSDGNIHISHQDNTNRDLRYCEGKETEWTCQEIDDVGEAGNNSSIFEGADGNIHIGHDNDGDLRYCEGKDEEWTCQTLATNIEKHH